MGEYGFMFLKCHYLDSYRSSLNIKYLVLDHKRRSVNYFVVTMHVNTIVLSYNKFSGDLADQLWVIQLFTRCRISLYTIFMAGICNKWMTNNKDLLAVMSWGVIEIR